MVQPRLRMQVSLEGRVTVLRPAGWITAGRQGILLEELSRQLEKGNRHIVVDLSAAHFVRSAEFGVLLFFQRELRQQGGCLALASPSWRTQRVLHLSDLRRAFTVCEDVDEAVRAIAASPQCRQEASGKGMSIGRQNRNR